MRGEIKRLEKLKHSYLTFYKNYSLQFALGLIWLSAAFIGTFDTQLSILTLFTGITFLRPFTFLVSRILKIRKIHKDESLIQHIKITIIGILFGMIVGFFPFVENINYFFPTFGLIFGLIFACIAYTSRQYHYGILSLLLISAAIYFGYYFEENFSYAGYFCGCTLTFFGVINGLAGKRHQVIFRLLRKKNKARWRETIIKQTDRSIIQVMPEIKTDKEKISG